MLEVRTVFLSKDADDTSNPLAYRPLKITSAIYRRWATARLKSLEPWIDSWDLDALHVIGGKGASVPGLRLLCDMNSIALSVLTPLVDLLISSNALTK